MKQSFALFAALMLATPAAFAYQVTGPVLEVTDTKIVVEKDKEKWEIARDKDTKVTGDLKKGARVTVQYRMTAQSVEVKDKPAGKEKASGKDKAASKDKDAKPAK